MIDNIDYKKLKNNYCILELLTYNHLNDLINAAADGQLWNLPHSTIPKPRQMKAEIARRLDLKDKGAMIPFAVIHPTTKRAIGMTTYCKIDNLNMNLNIGWTWYAQSYQRTAINTNCKLLLLTHAFEDMNFNCVCFKVDIHNQSSNKAVVRLGARFIELINNYQTMPGKTPQDLNHYCINLVDWPLIKKAILSKKY